MKITSLSSIENNPINEWEYISQKNDYKIEYSEVFTPFKLAKEMVEFIPMNNLSTSTCKFLDAGCGNGNITIILYKILYESLSILNKQEHILKNMLHVIDINNKRLEELKKILPLDNIQNTDFLSTYVGEQYIHQIHNSNNPVILSYQDVFKKIKNISRPYFINFVKKILTFGNLKLFYFGKQEVKNLQLEVQRRIL